MGFRKIISLLAFLAIIPVFSGGPAYSQSKAKTPPPKRSILFILDASGSMTLRFGTDTRMAMARSLLLEHLSRIKKTVPVGLMAYGNGIYGCDSVRLYNPIALENRNQVSARVRKMVSSGSTPLALSLKLVEQKILPKNPNTTIVVISDGAESCGGNPVAQAARLRKLGANVHIIGLSVRGPSSNQLRDIAKAGSGKYFPVNNFREFEQAFLGSIDSKLSNRPVVKRTRRNLRAERKWGMRTYAFNHDRDQRYNRARYTKTKSRSFDPRKGYFLITKVRRKSVERGHITYEISYFFKLKEPGNYHVSIQAASHPRKQGPTGKLRPGLSLTGLAGEAFFAVNSGQGMLELKVPMEDIYRAPMYVQGELWDTSEVPDNAHLSNSMILH